MKKLQKVWDALRAPIGYACMLLAAVLFLNFATGNASAQTDITSTISTVSGYWDAVKVVAIAILLFVIGRRVVRKM